MKKAEEFFDENFLVDADGTVQGYVNGRRVPLTRQHMIDLLKRYALSVRIFEAEVSNEASFEPQEYLSRLDKKLDVDEAVKYFGKTSLLQEIGVKDAIDHFGEAKVKEELGVK